MIKICKLLPLRATFSEFSTKYAKDDRFKAVEKLRDREQHFQDFIVDMRKREKEEKEKEKKVSDIIDASAYSDCTSRLFVNMNKMFWRLKTDSSRRRRRQRQAKNKFTSNPR